MTSWRHTSPPPPIHSGTRRSRRSIHDKDLDDDVSMIPDNFNDRHDDNSESDYKPLW